MSDAIVDSLSEIIPFFDVIYGIIQQIVTGSPVVLEKAANYSVDFLKLLLSVPVYVLVGRYLYRANKLAGNFIFRYDFLLDMLTAFLLSFGITILLRKFEDPAGAVFVLYIAAIAGIIILAVLSMLKGVLSFSRFVLKVFLSFIKLVLSYCILLCAVVMPYSIDPLRILSFVIAILALIVVQVLLGKLFKWATK